jgi:hypothetical protein
MGVKLGVISGRNWLRVFENRVLRKILGRKKDEVKRSEN